MLTTTRLKNGRNINYGLGFSVGIDDSGKYYFYHEGSGTGFISQLLIYRNERLAVAYLINCVDRNPGNPGLDLAKLFNGILIPPLKSSVSDHLLNITLSNGIDSALIKLKVLQRDTLTEYNINEDELILFGNDLLNLKMNREAIQLFKVVTNEYHGYFKGFVGLGDAYLKDGNEGLALRNYRMALKLNPLNNYVADMIKKLESK
jgi:tetratricopeptide (TPR) repeat protein